FSCSPRFIRTEEGQHDKPLSNYSMIDFCRTWFTTERGLDLHAVSLDTTELDRCRYAFGSRSHFLQLLISRADISIHKDPLGLGHFFRCINNSGIGKNTNLRIATGSCQIQLLRICIALVLQDPIAGKFEGQTLTVKVLNLRKS